MRTMFSLSALVVVGMLLSLGGTPNVAVGEEMYLPTQPMDGCVLRFHDTDIGDKGYLDQRDLRERSYGASPGASTGKSAAKFATMDRNEDGQVSVQEWCEWRAPVAPRPYRSG
ncbi:MAG: hypothetical protein AB9873_06160 [Syntrophobacteraceae bacterium]